MKKVVLHIARILMLLLPISGCCNLIRNSNLFRSDVSLSLSFCICVDITHLYFYLMYHFSFYCLHQISILYSVLHYFLFIVDQEVY